jgi:hypothetical protein
MDSPGFHSPDCRLCRIKPLICWYSGLNAAGRQLLLLLQDLGLWVKVVFMGAIGLTPAGQ